MAKKNKPLSVYVALDRSGSMQGERWTHAINLDIDINVKAK
jgi:uncharacterized protein with von Willebrand factor type A (vWA) domain